MQDLTSPTWIKVKGLLFLLIGSIAAVLLLLDNANWKTACCWRWPSGASAGSIISRFTSSKNTLIPPTNFPA